MEAVDCALENHEQKTLNRLTHKHELFLDEKAAAESPTNKYTDANIIFTLIYLDFRAEPLKQFNIEFQSRL